MKSWSEMLQKAKQTVSIFCRILLVDGKRPTGKIGSPKREELEFDDYISGRLAVSKPTTLSGRIDVRDVCVISKLQRLRRMVWRDIQ